MTVFADSRLHIPVQQGQTPVVEHLDVPLALGALLVRIARSDHHYLDIEAHSIDRILSLRHDLTLAEAADLRHCCENLEARAPDTHRYARFIKNAVPYADRLAIALTLWDVMMADGIKHPNESAMVSLAEDVLGVVRGDLPAAG